jgi:hypothetical protein
MVLQAVTHGRNVTTQSTRRDCKNGKGAGRLERAALFSLRCNIRAPDIAYYENVRSGRRSGGRGGTGLPWRAGKGKPYTRWRTHRKANPQTGAGEGRRRLVELFAQGLGGVRSMRRAERSQRDLQLAVRNAGVAYRGEEFMQQGSSLLMGTGVVRSQQRKQIALSLIGNHLDDVGQVLAFRGELDHRPPAEVADLNALENVTASLEESCHVSAGGV